MLSQPKAEVKHIADIVGEWGRWQLELFLYKFLVSATAAFINMGYSFHVKSVDFWCSDVPQEFIFNKSITDRFRCHKYINPEEVCNEWTYNTSQYKKSIITEFDLVCGRSNYGSLTQSCFMLGYVVSGLVICQLSDKYGRRPMVWFSFTLEVFAIISCGLSVNIYQYIISRFLVGVGHSGGGYAVNSILVECCGPKHRSDIVLLASVGWVLGYVLLPGFAYWLQDFRYLQLMSAIPLIMMVSWYYFLYESPRWQITNGKVDSAEQTIRKALKKNGKALHDLKENMKLLVENLQKTNNDQGKPKSYTLLDLFKTRNMRKYTFILWYSWIVNALVYYGISFNMSDFGGNFYISFLLSGLVELPGQLLTPLLLRYIGRRTLYAIFMYISAISTLAIIPAKAEWLQITFALICKFAVTNSWNVLGVYASEIYPTVMRTTGYGVASVVGRVGSLGAPFMGNLAMITGLTFVMIFYGILSTMGGLLSLLLPETKDREIPDTIEETENFHSNQNKSNQNRVV